MLPRIRGQPLDTTSYWPKTAWHGVASRAGVVTAWPYQFSTANNSFPAQPTSCSPSDSLRQLVLSREMLYPTDARNWAGPASVVGRVGRVAPDTRIDNAILTAYGPVAAICRSTGERDTPCGHSPCPEARQPRHPAHPLPHCRSCHSRARRCHSVPCVTAWPHGSLRCVH